MSCIDCCGMEKINCGNSIVYDSEMLLAVVNKLNNGLTLIFSLFNMSEEHIHGEINEIIKFLNDEYLNVDVLDKINNNEDLAIKLHISGTDNLEGHVDELFYSRGYSKVDVILRRKNLMKNNVSTFVL